MGAAPFTMEPDTAPRFPRGEDAALPLPGDAATVLGELPAGFADMCLTSPSPWGQRVDVGPAPDGIGREPAPEAYVARLAQPDPSAR